MAEAGRAPWSPSGLTPSQQGRPEQVARAYVQKTAPFVKS